jgi:hypothetical protein
MEQSRQYFLSQGWTPEQVAGILSNESSESSFDPQAPGGGLFQWSDPKRQQDFRLFSGTDIPHSTVAQQLAFAQWELTHTEKRAGDALHRARGSYESGMVFSLDYERPLGGFLTAQYRGEQAAQYMTPLPPEASSLQDKQQVQHTATLHVVHQNQDGHVIDKQELPMTTVQDPQPWGLLLPPNILNSTAMPAPRSITNPYPDYPGATW